MSEPTIYDIVTMDDVISQYYRERPMVFWEIGRELLPQLQQLKDNASRYVMSIGAGNTILGVPYRIVDGKGLRLVTEAQS